MFKKSLAAVAVLGAFAASSFAADVTFYGKLDAGFKYENTEINYIDGTTDTIEALTLDSGVQDASRFGIKGTEDLGNGYKVSFVLENGFKGDDGNMSTDGKLFDRQAHLTLATPFGNFTAGRTGAFSTASGPYDVVFSRADAFDGGHKDVFGFASIAKQDNLLSYQTPKFAGFQATAQYSFKSGSDGDEGHRNANHYAGVAMTYDVGALQTAVSYEQMMRSDEAVFGNTKHGLVDSKIVTFGGNYDFDMFKLFAMGQVFEGMDKMGDFKWDDTAAGDQWQWISEDGVEGYALHVGATFAALGGEWETAVYYGDYQANDMHAGDQTKDVDGEYFGVAARYAYALSSRTFVKASVGYDELTWDKWYVADSHKTDFEKTRYFGRVSLVHNF